MKMASLDPWQNASFPIAARTADLLSRLSVGEKIGLTLDNQPGIPRLGLPPFKIGNDCLHGVTSKGTPATPRFACPV